MLAPALVGRGDGKCNEFLLYGGGSHLQAWRPAPSRQKGGFFLSLYSSSSASFSCCFYPHLFVPNGRNPQRAKFLVLNSIYIKNSPNKKARGVQISAGLAGPSPQRIVCRSLKSQGGIQLHGSSGPQPARQAFSFSFSVTLDSAHSFFFEGEKIFLTARFRAWLSSGRPLAFHLLSSITFSRTFPTKPLGLESKEEGIRALKERCPSLFLDEWLVFIKTE